MIDSEQVPLVSQPSPSPVLPTADQKHLSTVLDTKESKLPVAVEIKLNPQEISFAQLLVEIQRWHDENVSLEAQAKFIKDVLNQSEERINQLYTAYNNHKMQHPFFIGNDENQIPNSLETYFLYIFGFRSLTPFERSATFFNVLSNKPNILKMPEIIHRLAAMRIALESATAWPDTARVNIEYLRQQELLKNLRSINLTNSSVDHIQYLVGNHLFRDANLTHAQIRNKNLAGTDFSNSNLTYADLSGCNLEDSYLNNSKLVRTNLEEANLGNAILAPLIVDGMQAPRLLNLDTLLSAKLSFSTTLDFIFLDILTGQGNYKDYSAWQFFGFMGYGHNSSLGLCHALFFLDFLGNNLVKLATQLPFYLAESAFMSIGYALQNNSLQNNQIQTNSLSYGLGLVFQAFGYAFKAIRLVLIEPIISPDISYGRARQLSENWSNLKYLSLAWSLTVNTALLLFPISNIVGYLGLSKLPVIGQAFAFISQGTANVVFEIVRSYSILPQCVASWYSLFAHQSKTTENAYFDSAPTLRLD